MANTDEKQRRKALRTQAKRAKQAEQEAALPLSIDDLKALFDYLDAKLGSVGCDHTTRHSEAFLIGRQLPLEPILPWLLESGGGCDCEVLANVEETWGERADSVIAAR